MVNHEWATMCHEVWELSYAVQGVAAGQRQLIDEPLTPTRQDAISGLVVALEMLTKRLGVVASALEHHALTGAPITVAVAVAATGAPT